MTGRVYQGIISQTAEILGYECGLIDDHGEMIACSDESQYVDTGRIWHCIIESKEDYLVIEDIAYLKSLTRNKLEFVVYANKTGQNVRECLSILALSIQNFKTVYDEKYDRTYFVKNILLDNILPGDISLKSRELHLSYNTSRGVFLVRTQNCKDHAPYEVLQSLFPNRGRDFIVLLDDDSIALVRELKQGEENKELEKTARIIVDNLNSELMVKASVGIGSIAANIREIGKSFKEAQTALMIVGIFENDRSVVNYNSLGIGRLIYQLPVTLCRLFLNEIFKDEPIDALDNETLLTIQKFFENNLNISETSRQLYVHRNTLVYRLDKIQKVTRLDLRKFDDAIIFKVSMLVKKYLDRMEK